MRARGSSPTLAMKATRQPKIFMAMPVLETAPPVPKAMPPMFTRVPGRSTSPIRPVAMAVSKRGNRSRHRWPAATTSNSCCLISRITLLSCSHCTDSVTASREV